MKELEKIDEADEFIDRVKKERAADYDSIIKNPMYLIRMKQKVKNGDYDTPQQVAICLSHPQNLTYNIIMPSLCS